MGDPGTRGKKVVGAVMAPLVITYDGVVHRDTAGRWNDFVPDIQVDWVQWPGMS